MIELEVTRSLMLAAEAFLIRRYADFWRWRWRRGKGKAVMPYLAYNVVVTGQRALRDEIPGSLDTRHSIVITAKRMPQWTRSQPIP